MKKPDRVSRAELAVRIAVSLIFLGAGTLCASPAQVADTGKPSMEERIKTGFDHVYSLDCDKADMVFRSMVEAFPDDPAGYCYIAANIWLRFLNERQELEVENFTSAVYFSKPSDKPLDPQLVQQFEQNADRCAAKAQAILAKEPKNVRALYFLGAAYGNIAAFHATVQRSLWSAFLNGGKAHECHEKVLKLDPRYFDAGLTVGLYEYIAGSIPWSVKWLAVLVGYRGNKEKGLNLIRMAADKARYNRKDAQVIAAVLLVREERPKEAIAYLEPLQKEYPRNPLLRIDLAGIYAKAGRHKDSIAAYQDILRRCRERQDHYERVRLYKIYSLLGEEFLADRQYAEARQAYEQGLRESQQNPAATLYQASYHLRLGQVCDLLQDRPAAVSHYEQVLNFSDSSFQEQARKYLKTPYRRVEAAANE